ncbi:MAG: hypothetical protein HY860_00410 [Chlamydiales bacterium]|nr:hypothetical protein [Chlamydiales bacterium]
MESTATNLTILALKETWDDVIIHEDFTYTDKSTAVWLSRAACVLSCGCLTPSYNPWVVVAERIVDFLTANPSFLLLPTNCPILVRLSDHLTEMSHQRYQRYHHRAIAYTTEALRAIDAALAYPICAEDPDATLRLLLSCISYSYNGRSHISISQLDNHIDHMNDMMEAYSTIFPILKDFNQMVLRLVICTCYIENTFSTPLISYCPEENFSFMFDNLWKKPLPTSFSLTKHNNIRTVTSQLSGDSALFHQLMTIIGPTFTTPRALTYLMLNIPKTNKLPLFNIDTPPAIRIHCSAIYDILKCYMNTTPSLFTDLPSTRLFFTYFYMRPYYTDDAMIDCPPALARFLSYLLDIPSMESSSYTLREFFIRLSNNNTLFYQMEEEIGLNKEGTYWVDYLILSLISSHWQVYFDRDTPNTKTLLECINAHIITCLETPLSTEAIDPVFFRLFCMYHYLYKYSTTPLRVSCSPNIAALIFRALWKRDEHTPFPHITTVRELFVVLTGNESLFTRLEDHYQIVSSTRRHTA